MARQYSKSAGKDVKSAMHRRKTGTLKKGKGGKGGSVKSRKQAIAIGLSEARKKGKKVPPKKSTARKSTGKKTAARKTATSRKTTARTSTARKTTKRKTTRKSSK